MTKGETIDASRGAEDVEATATELGEKTLAHLLDVARRSFERGIDLDESVWRSLPLFAAVFGLAATLVGTAVPMQPRFDGSLFAWVNWTLVFFAVMSFVWSFRWVVVVTQPRSFEYPSTPTEVRDYAQSLLAYHGGQTDVADELDKRVHHDLMDFDIAQLGNASAVNDGHVRVRLKARSQALRFMVIGFALACANSITIYTSEAWRRSLTPAQRGIGDDRGTPTGVRDGEANGNSASGPAKSEDRRTGRRVSQTVDESRGSGQAHVTDKDDATSVPSVTPSLPKPQAPPPQRLEKSVTSSPSQGR